MKRDSLIIRAQSELEMKQKAVRNFSQRWFGKPFSVHVSLLHVQASIPSIFPFIIAFTQQPTQPIKTPTETVRPSVPLSFYTPR